ncbi:MAG: hypothetical protein LBE36_06990 [Flavobacteriaceae bacterium]|jgi:hypothetical protein|nr:hypothetical protein [Flavobacteriaceae bacterium]
MKNILTAFGFLFSVVIFAQNSKLPILERKFEGSLISRGDNIPDFRVRKDSANFLLIYLHKNLSVSEFEKDTKLSHEITDRIITLLKNKNWLSEKTGKLKPTVFIATEADGAKLYHYAKPISAQIAGAIEKDLPNIKAEFSKTEMAENQSFEHWSFLILSDVLLDSWNIFEMESGFFKQKDGSSYNRPLRHGKNYYASYMENTEKNSEPFKIYGNQGLKFTDSLQVWVYGNNRQTDYYHNLESSANKITNSDNQILKKTANHFLPKLLNILENNRKYIEKVYRKTGYSREISFEEFFIWWYHFIYTQATENLKNKGILTIPPSGNFDYEIENY